MFVQVIQGQVSDPPAMRVALDGWLTELSPGAEGWLGSTSGVTDDGRFVALVRFATSEAARRNSGRPEQDAWWVRTSELFTGQVVFRDSEDVVSDIVGDPDRAGFVQVMQGRGSDPDRARELASRDSESWAAFRPDIIGSLMILHDGGEWTMAVYFTSEDDARAGEGKEAPPELKAQMEEMASLNVGEPEFFDLRRPWLHSPR